MADVILPRRAFLAGLAAAIAAPAIVRVASIMPVKQMEAINIDEMAAILQARMDAAEHDFARQLAQSLYGNHAWRVEEPVSTVRYVRTTPKFKIDGDGFTGRWVLA